MIPGTQFSGRFRPASSRRVTAIASRSAVEMEVSLVTAGKNQWLESFWHAFFPHSLTRIWAIYTPNSRSGPIAICLPLM